MCDQRIAGGIVAYGGNGQDPRAKRRQIVGSVCTAAGDKLGFAVFQDQHGGFARDARNFTKAKFVGDEIAEKYNSLRTELLDTFRKR